MKPDQLQQLKTEVELLKKQKKRKLQLSASTNERNRLLMEIKQLDEVKKSPSALKSFGKTFGRGLKLSGQTLWRGITTASKNLDTNAPEIKEFSQSMTQKPKPIAYKKPMKKKPKKMVYNKKQMSYPMNYPEPVYYTKPMKKKVMKKKSKKRKQKARKMVYNQKEQEMHSWGFP